MERPESPSGSLNRLPIRIHPSCCTLNSALELKLRVLIVDDHSVNRRLPTTLLRQHGWEVDGAPDGETALQMLAAKRFDAVLLDLNMPVTSGFEVCRRLRADDTQKHLRIIACTAVSAIEKLPPAAGFDGLLRKPYTPEALMAVLTGPLNEMQERGA
jgi:CheY-like chemotaxis protein